MKKIVAIVLISFVGFLGCSDSDDGTSTTIGEAIPVAPFGIIDTFTPTYEWIPVPGATEYRLLVQDTNATTVIDESYTAVEAGCASEDTLCMATPEINVFDKNTWKVKACSGPACGTWSEVLPFDFTTMDIPRFTDNGDETVTDNNTQLTWTKNVDLFGEVDGYDSHSKCYDLTLSTYDDWRLPSTHEVCSLIDPTQSNPAFPQDHPFTNIPAFVWTTDTWVGTDDQGIVNLIWGTVGSELVYNFTHVWCVRSDDYIDASSDHHSQSVVADR